MTLKKKKRLAAGLLTLALVGLSSMTAIANDFDYSGELPAFQGHITLVGGSAEKTNRNSRYAKNNIKELGNSNRYAVCWVDNTTSGGRTLATAHTACEIYTTKQIDYNDHYWSGSAELRAHASDYGWEKTWIKGYVDLG